jgi:hypothetical protein
MSSVSTRSPNTMPASTPGLTGEQLHSGNVAQGTGEARLETGGRGEQGGSEGKAEGWDGEVFRG